MSLERIEFLVDRYLDGMITPEEQAVLDRLLVSDPAATRRFVDRVRLDSALYRHYREARAGAGAEYGRAVRGLSGELRTSRFRHAVDHLWGPAAAVLIHAALLLLLLRWVFLPGPIHTPPVTVSLDPEPVRELDPRLPDELQEFSLDESTPIDVPLSITLLPKNINGFPLYERHDVFPSLAPRELAQDWTDTLRPALPERYASRSLSSRRDHLSRIAGQESELFDRAIENALSSLAESQDWDGGWPLCTEAGAVENTALAVLAFLSRGHTPGNPLYGHIVEAGLRRLMIFSPDIEAGVICAEARLLALAEAYALARIPSLVPVIQAETERLLSRLEVGVSATAPDGPEAVAYDALRMTWLAQALTAVQAAGLAPVETRAALASIVGYTKTRHDPAGSNVGGASAPNALRTLRTASAWRTLQLLGEGRSPEARRCKVLLRSLLRDLDLESTWPLLALHEAALSLLGGGEPDYLRVRMLLRRSASVVPEDQPEAGAVQSRTLALAALTLGAPYRHAEVTPVCWAAMVEPQTPTLCTAPVELAASQRIQ